jgi:hypothetical protein
MDLGFGPSNQSVGSVAAAALLRSARAHEEALEVEISRFDALLEDSEALEALRARRLDELRRRRDEDRRRRELGHGAYGDLLEAGAGGSAHTADAARAFFEAAKRSSRLVVHFHRPSTRYCDVFHKHLAALAERHLETRFVSINVENCVENARGSNSSSGAAFLVERLGIVVMPTLLIVKDRRSVHQLRGFDELGNTPDFSTAALERVLGRYGALDCDTEGDDPGDGED